MKRIKIIIAAFCSMMALNASAVEENIKIDGDHGKLDAILQTPLVNKGQKIPLVIICHGFSGNKNEPLLKGLADSLQVRGIASIRFDFNGHGKSEGRFQDMTVLNEIVDAKKVYDYASKLNYVSDIYMAGHSQGGVVTAMTAGEMGNSKIKAIALMAPAAALRDDALRGNTFGKMYDPENPPAEIPLFGNVVLGGNFVKTAIDLPIYETAMKYEGEAYVIHGKADRVVPYTYGERFKQQMKHAEFHLMMGMDHGFSNHTGEIDHLVAEFFLNPPTTGNVAHDKLNRLNTNMTIAEASAFWEDEGDVTDLGGGYTKDKKHAYYKGKKIRNVQNLKDFYYKGNGYASDGMHDYYKGKVVERN